MPTCDMRAERADTGSMGKPAKRAARVSGAKATSTALAEKLLALAPERSLVRVALVFFATYAALQAAIWWFALRGHLDSFIEMTTVVAGACVTGTGIAATIAGNQIQLASRILQIDLDCTGISLAAVYSALVVAYPLSARRKALGLAVGLPVLALANFVRLTAVAHLSERLGHDAFSFVHDYLFMIGMVTVVVALWGGYLALARRHAAKR